MERSENLQAAVARAASDAGLGHWLRTYLPVRLDWRRYRTVVIVTIVSCWALVVSAVAQAYIVAIIALVFVVVFGGRLLLEVGWIRFVANRNRDARLDRYERGFVYVYQGRVSVFRYDTTRVWRKIVQRIEYGTPTHITYTYTCTDLMGDPIVLGDVLERPDEWGEAIQHAVAAAQLPPARAALATGQRLEFDEIWMTEGAVGSGAETVGWGQLEEIAVQDGFVRLRVAGKWRALIDRPVSDIPNFLVFHTLAEELRRAHSSTA
ncbi:DUF6585 family protein [Nocardia sp. NPDC050710]|uniref:DUF6585 family protein n=1 Tax=Nocardia sp. NPDC050710 TaxID=3157220 RepID=UPI0033D33625